MTRKILAMFKGLGCQKAYTQMWAGDELLMGLSNGLWVTWLELYPAFNNLTVGYWLLCGREYQKKED